MMSRYLVDKFLYRVDRHEATLKAYVEDPAGFVADWEEGDGRRLHEGERTSGHRFTEEERAALATLDYGKLYAMGAHPFLLWTLMRGVFEPRYPDFRALVDAYNAQIRPHGRPDFGT